MTSCPHFDLLNPATYVDGVPFEQLKELRNACPVSKQRDTDNDMDYWAITRREDIDFISKKPKIFSLDYLIILSLCVVFMNNY